MPINTKITTEFERVIKENTNKFSSNLSRLNQANERYNKLIEKGTIKKRGYTLRGIEDMHLFHFRINS